VRRIRPRAVIAAGLLVLMAGCGGDDGSRSVEDGFRVQDDTPVPEGARTIPVDGFSYGYTPAEIAVAPGEPVALSFTSTESLHDLLSEDLDVYAYAQMGETAVGGFTAPDQPGRYVFWCTIPGHLDAGMEGVIVVG
jgi:plastocyanin